MMMIPTRTPSALSAVLRDIQFPVQEELSRVPAELWRIVASDVPLVREVQEHLVGTKGKLFRPTLLLLSSSLAGKVPEQAITYAAVVELMHLATLVHDDAVDHSVLRRGMPTVNALFSHQVSVIMGDFLYLRALRELVTIGDLKAMTSITDASNEMTLGEVRQLSAYDALAFTQSDYETLIRGKTAALFMAACDVGALCGGNRYREAMTRYGERLGMAFQVADDLLDYTEAQEMTGKPRGLDLREHKVTLPLIAALREMSASDRLEVEALFASPEPSDEAIAGVMEIVRENGGLEYARQRAEQFSREAEEALAGIPDNASRTALVDAIAYSVDRRW